MKSRILTAFMAMLLTLSIIPPVSVLADGALFYDPNSGLAINFPEEFEIIMDGMTPDEDEIVWLHIGNPCHLGFFDWGYLYDIYKDKNKDYNYTDEQILEIFIKYFINDLFEDIFGKPEKLTNEELYLVDIEQYGAEYDTDGRLVSYASGMVDRLADETVWTVFGELTYDRNGGIYFTIAVFPKYQMTLYALSINRVMYSVRKASSKNDAVKNEPKAMEWD